MNRRLFLRHAALLTASVVAADQMDIVERLGWTRRLFAGWRGIPTLYGDGIHDDTDGMRALLMGGDVWDARTRRRLTGMAEVEGGRYRVTDTINLTHRQSIIGPKRSLQNATLIADPPFSGPMLRYNGAPSDMGLTGATAQFYR